MLEQNYNPIQSLNKMVIDFNIPNVNILPDHTSDLNKVVNANVSTTSTQTNQLPIGDDNLDQLHQTIVNHAIEVDFMAYIDQLGGNHEKYIKDGKDKIPLAVIAVIVNHYTVKMINSIGYSINQLYSNENEVKAAYLFNGKYWLPITDSWIKNLLREILIKMGYDSVEAKTFGISEILIKTFWIHAPKTPIKDNSKILVNLNNCTLEVLANGEIKQLPFSSDNFLMYSLPYDYNRLATMPQFSKYLDRVLPDKESQNVLQELLGSIFIKNINLEKIGILLGTGSNGKSVLLKIVTAVLSHNNVSQMDLKALTTDKNADNNRSHLHGKLLNFAPEINARGEQCHDLIKRMASGEAIQAKLMYKDTFTMTDYAKLIFNANALPSDVEYSHGFFRRFLIVDFNQTIKPEEQDPDLANKIIANELPAILNWIIEGAKRIQQNKKFSPCKRSDEILEQYKLDSDVVALWLEEYNYEPDEYLTQLLKDLYDKFRGYVNCNGYKLISDRTLVKRLRHLGYKTKKPVGHSTSVFIRKVEINTYQ